MIRLISSDDRVFEVSLGVIQLSQFLKLLYEDIHVSEIKLDKITGAIIELVVKYCTYHAAAAAAAAADPDDAADPADPADWDAEFIRSIEIPVLCKLINAANFLHIESLIDLCSKRFVLNIHTMTVSEVRKSLEEKM